jgi:hypothetical protein
MNGAWNDEFCFKIDLRPIGVKDHFKKLDDRFTAQANARE